MAIQKIADSAGSAFAPKCKFDLGDTVRYFSDLGRVTGSEWNDYRGQFTVFVVFGGSMTPGFYEESTLKLVRKAR